LIILGLLFLLTPLIIEQSFQVYLKSQQLNFKQIIENVFPSLFPSEDFAAEVGSVLNAFITKSVNSFVNSFSKLVLNLPSFLLQMLIVFSTFFFVLRDREGLMEYVRSLMPFTKDVETKMFNSSKDITLSVIYGQFLVGTLQGILVGIGFFIFGVKNALFLTILAILAGIFPLIGTTIVWIPVIIFLFLAGNNFSAFGVAFFGIVAAFIDNIIRPVLVSKRARVHPLLVLIGMIGGLFLFGILGFILGPLIIAYVLIILEIYRGKQIKGIFITNPI
jgi:predicted PurR-regulated permease PerM